MIDILNILHGDLLPCKFEWGAQIHFPPCLFFFFYRELLLKQTRIFLILYSTASLKLATILNHSLSLKFTLFYRKYKIILGAKFLLGLGVFEPALLSPDEYIFSSFVRKTKSGNTARF